MNTTNNYYSNGSVILIVSIRSLHNGWLKWRALEKLQFSRLLKCFETRFENFFNAPSKYFGQAFKQWNAKQRSHSNSKHALIYIHKKNKRFYESENFFGWFWCQIVLKWWYIKKEIRILVTPTLEKNIRNAVHWGAKEQCKYNALGILALFIWKTRSNYFLFGLGSIRYCHYLYESSNSRWRTPRSFCLPNLHLLYVCVVWSGVESFYPTRFAIAIFPYFVSAFYVPPKSLEKNWILFYFLLSSLLCITLCNILSVKSSIAYLFCFFCFIFLWSPFIVLG